MPSVSECSFGVGWNIGKDGTWSFFTLRGCGNGDRNALGSRSTGGLANSSRIVFQVVTTKGVIQDRLRGLFGFRYNFCHRCRCRVVEIEVEIECIQACVARIIRSYGARAVIKNLWKLIYPFDIFWSATARRCRNNSRLIYCAISRPYNRLATFVDRQRWREEEVCQRDQILKLRLSVKLSVNLTADIVQFRLQ